MFHACRSVWKRACVAVAAALLILPGHASEITKPVPIKDGDYRKVDPKSAALGRLLFYDKILSGNRNIACGTCHSHEHATADGLSLGVGEGGIGLGPKRRFGEGRDIAVKRVPRNANALFNLGHKDFRVLFHDGRLSADDTYGNGFNTPAEEWFPKGLTSIAAAQAMFPITSRVEMAGDPAENDIAASRRERIDHVWPKLARRVSAIPEYRERFGDAFGIKGSDITMVHIANAIGDFIISEWRSDTAPFDAWLKGEANVFEPQQKAGAALFYGKADCASCHSGPLLTNQKFYSLALPPLGPGRTRPFDPYARDVGRMAETDDITDAYRFRTPSLRNISKTGPYGHNGAYASLDGIIRHHLDPVAALESWNRDQVVLPKQARFAIGDFAIWEDAREMERLKRRVDIEPVSLTDPEIAALIEFLNTLDDPTALAGRLGKPTRVPSGLAVD